MPRLRKISPNEAPPEAPKSIVFSKKAQLYLGYKGINLNEILQLRDAYIEARTLENINRITAFEMETLGVAGAINKFNRRMRRKMT